jgi:hypothetical protein
MPSKKKLYFSFGIALVGLLLAVFGMYEWLVENQFPRSLALFIGAVAVLVMLIRINRGRRSSDEEQLRLLEESNRAMIESLRGDKQP